SLSLEDVQDVSAPKVMPGSMFESRLLIRKRIDDLKEEGTDVRFYEAGFNDLEASVKQGNGEILQSKLKLLSDRLRDQEDLLAQARKAAAGKGVPAVKQTEPVRSDHLTRLDKMRAPGTSVDKMVLNLFAKRSDDLLKRLTKGNGADLKDARALKQAADDLIAAGKEKQAIIKIRQLSAIFVKHFGSDPFVSGNFPRRARSGKLVNGHGSLPKPPVKQ
ncbi:MAG: hypothetical protein K8F91_24895, partial [Candidatus Obscuribacterales bacterium]|nr:hypothetical protein [Candidatus Obscuribacterales bacterium]